MDHDSLPGIEKGFALLQKLILYRTAIIDVHIEISTFIGIFSEVPQRLKKRVRQFSHWFAPTCASHFLSSQMSVNSGPLKMLIIKQQQLIS